MMWLWNKQQLRTTTRNSSTTHSYQCVSRQWYCCQCLGFLTCAQTLMHATAYGGCMDTTRESALKADSLAALGTQIGISIPHGFSVRCPTNLATPAPMLVMRQSQRQNTPALTWKKWGHNGDEAVTQRQNTPALTWRQCRSQWGCGNHRDKTY